eukprot:779469-Ditylum_brightwellii.AAC.1
MNVNFYYAVPAATKGSAFLKLKHKGGHAKGVTPKKTSVAQKGAKQERHLRFFEGKGAGQYYT